MLGNPIGSLNTLESMKKTVVRGSAIILAALGVSISLSACTINFGSAGMSGDHSMMDHSSTAGFNSEDIDSDDTYDSIYVNGSYALASGANVFAEVRDSDNRDDVAYTFGMQVKF